MSSRRIPAQRSESKNSVASSYDSANGGTFGSSYTNTDRMRKVVSIDEPDMISPLMIGKSKQVDDRFSLDQSLPKQHSAKIGKRMSGRSNSQAVEMPTFSALSLDGTSDMSDSGRRGHPLHNVVDEIGAWLHAEKARRKERKANRKHKSRHHSHLSEALQAVTGHRSSTEQSHDQRRASDSSGSGDSDALEKLESILQKGSSSNVSMLGRTASRKQSIRNPRNLSTRQLRPATSDLDDVDDQPPSCNATLDNTKTLTYYGGSSSSHADATAKPASKNDREAWLEFKFEIVRLAHTLKLKGWRQVPMESSANIDVERLSGALTNAVYVVAPPKDLPLRPNEGIESSQSLVPRKPPPKLLLRIYGPQVEHLIDREAELRILRRLARKRIGPRMLGTFKNGRFEEFFHARTLKPQDLRDPATSRQIAKRMRELHEGIALLEEERDAGPFVWKNWDNWLDRCEKIVTHVDGQVTNEQPADAESTTTDVEKRGLVCGTDWNLFKTTVQKYRAWLDEQYGGVDRLREQLVFAHNDTQYGNILRLEPAGESPLLLPANQHKQLVVIDFEYSNANMLGLEFANHFTEWCYNYHDPTQSFVCHTSTYPTIEEQKRFIRSYVVHQPQYAPAASSTPRLLPRELSFSASSSSTPAQTTLSSTKSMPIGGAKASATIVERPGLSSSFSNLSIDSRFPRSRPQSSYFDQGGPGADDPDLGNGTGNLTAEPAQMDLGLDEDAIQDEITSLMHETRLWRLANSAQWVAWGVVQAHVPGLEHLSVPEVSHSSSQASTPKVSAAAAQHSPGLHSTAHLDSAEGTDPRTPEFEAAVADMADRRPEDPVEAEEEGFDYLSYARERALFFWGDALQFGFVTEDELKKFGLVVGTGEAGSVKVVNY